MRSDEVVGARHALDALNDARFAQATAGLVGHVKVVMGLGPVDSYKDHQLASPFNRDRPARASACQVPS
jgi:hypothetical protein